MSDIVSDIGARRRRRPHVLLGCCGSVASVKVPALVNALSCLGEVRVVATDAALAFMGNGPYCAKERRTVAAKYDAEEWDAFAARTARLRYQKGRGLTTCEPATRAQGRRRRIFGGAGRSLKQRG